MKNEKTARGRSQDRQKVAGAQDYEVDYEQGKTGTSGEAVKKAIKKSGNQRAAVEKALKPKSKRSYGM